MFATPRLPLTYAMSESSKKAEAPEVEMGTAAEAPVKPSDVAVEIQAAMAAVVSSAKVRKLPT